MKSRKPRAVSGPEALRRILLGAITALVVARPLVLGEDPGLLVPQYSDAGGLVLTLLWFLTAIGWGAWRLWTGQRSWRGSFVEAGLGVAVLLVFVSAFTAGYFHPAFLIAWEWLALLVAFCLVRQLVLERGEEQRLLAAVVAGGIALGAYALYHQSELTDRASHEKELTARGVNAEMRQQYLARLEMGEFATYAHPNSFAGYLVLVIPAALGWTIVSRRTGQPAWKTGVLALGVVVLLGALVFTKSRGAILGLGMVVMLIGMLHARVPVGLRRVFGIATALVVLGALTVVFGGTGESSAVPMGDAVERRLEYWTNSWKMLTDGERPEQLWIGVGPGNFGGAYLRYMSASDLEEVKDPHNFAIEMWTSSGVFALLALLAALVTLAWHCWPLLTGQAEEPAFAEETPRGVTRWEFYVGGMAGISLGFLLWGATVTDKDMLVVGAVAAGVRSIVWFAAFALFESVPWSGNSRGLAILAGVIALLVNLTISGGIAFPSVALLLWVMAALALNARPRDTVIDSQFKLLSLAPLPLAVAALFVFVSLVFYPVQVCQRGLQEARLNTPVYQNIRASAEQKGGQERIKALRDSQEYLSKRIIKPLEEAVKADPADAQGHIELAIRYGELWDLLLNYDVAVKQEQDRTKIRYLALGAAIKASELNPYEQSSDFLIYSINRKLALAPNEHQKAYQKAAEAMARIVERDPSRAIWRLWLAAAHLEAGNAEESARQAKLAKDLNDAVRQPLRKLSPEEENHLEVLLPRQQ